ncbi:MAG: hydrolase 1, exosortase A system-associated [Deltaproteobacteria bacterium]|nr:hydrolase 1, exosortase A system-associated [Deltaproteobacteria bacterium]
MSIETAVTFQCGADELIGIVHQPVGESAKTTGVLIVVGGPQYRVGSHRQFVQLARDSAARGIPVMRFDYRGMGDSEGEQISFEQTGPDIKAAIDTFTDYCPGVTRIVLWGLCDAASACLMYYALSDDRVKGMILLNPWVRTDAGIAKAHLKHYYTARFFEKGFWLKLLKLEFDYMDSWRSFIAQAKKSFSFNKESIPQAESKKLPFQKKMESGLLGFTGKILFIISGNDLTASEFKDVVSSSKNWKKKIKDQNITWCDIKEADHTFSKKEWKEQVAELTIKWVRKL